MNAQVDSTGFVNFESNIMVKLEQLQINFNEKLMAINQNHEGQLEVVVDELRKLSLEFKLSKTQLDSLTQLQMTNQKINLALKEKVILLENQLRNKIDGLKVQTNQLDNVTNTLTKELINAKSEVSEIAESSIKNTNSINTVNQALSQKQQYGLIFLTVFLFLILMIYILLSKKQSSSTKAIAAKQKEIFEKQIEDSQQLTNWLSEQSSKSLGKNSGGDVDHSFAKRVADEIVRITTNLSRMDSTIKGYKQLSASVRKLEQSLNSNGYELEDLLNKSYNNGMNLQANFVLDENLNQGESIITRIIKPQINYKGKLIQAAQVEVSQGE